MEDSSSTKEQAMDEWRSSIKLTDMACAGKPKVMHVGGITTTFRAVVQLMGALRFTLNNTVKNAAQGTVAEHYTGHPRFWLVLADQSSLDAFDAHVTKLQDKTAMAWELFTAENFMAEIVRQNSIHFRDIIVMFDSAGGTFPPNILTAAALLLRSWKREPAKVHNAILVTMSPDELAPWSDWALPRFFARTMPITILKAYPAARAMVESMAVPETDDATVEYAMAWSISKLLDAGIDANKPVTVLVRTSQVEACRIAHELRVSTCAGTMALRRRYQGQEHPFVTVLTASSLLDAWQALEESSKERGPSFRAVIFIDDSVRFLPELPAAFGSIHRLVSRTTPRKVWFRSHGVLAETRTRWTASELNAFAGIGLDADPKDPTILMCITRSDAGKSTIPQEAPLMRGTVEYAKETIFCFAHAFPVNAGPMCQLLNWPRDEYFMREMFRLVHRHDLIESTKEGMVIDAWAPPLGAFLWRVEHFRAHRSVKNMASHLMSGAARNLAEARLLLGAQVARSSRVRDTLTAVIALLRIGEGNLIQPLQLGTRSALAQIKPNLAGVGQDLCVRGRLWVAIGAYSAAMADIKSPAPTVALGNSLVVSVAALGELEAEHRRLLHVLGVGFSGGDWKQALNPSSSAESGPYLNPTEQLEVDKAMLQAWFGTVVTPQPSTKKLREMASWCIVEDDDPRPDELSQRLFPDPSEPTLCGIHMGLVWNPEERRFTSASIAKLPTSVFVQMVRDTMISKGISEDELASEYMIRKTPENWASDDIQADWF
jgi:hypothetical protein